MDYEELKKEWESDRGFIEARTSGSTGSPKVIRLPKPFVAASARRTNRFFDIGPGSRLHSCVSPDFIGGKMMGIRAWLAGARLTWESPSNRILADVGKNERIDLLALVPSQTLSLLDRLPDLPEMGSVIIGGSAIDPMLRQRLADSGLNAYETYGMTETASHIALRRVGEVETPFAPFDGIQVATDARGCLAIMFEDGTQVVTNDLAEVDANGSFRILGRIDNMIITGGRKVNPLEVEKKLSPYISRPFMIGPETDEKWGQRVVVRIEGDETEEDEDLWEVFRNVLQPWERPKRIYRVPELPRTANGKLKRKTGK